jgi:hypothetical protein
MIVANLLSPVHSSPSSSPPWLNGHVTASTSPGWAPTESRSRRRGRFSRLEVCQAFRHGSFAALDKVRDHGTNPPDLVLESSSADYPPEEAKR